MSIVWLASYPKSGNTWVRTWLTNYLSEDDKPVNINCLAGEAEATDRQLFSEILGINSSDLSVDSIMKLRLSFHQSLSTELKAPYFIKVHDMYHYNGTPLFSKKETIGVIYIVRNPLDIVSSYAHHANVNVERIIKRMGMLDYTVYSEPNGIFEQLPQLMGSWSQHVESWLDLSSLRTLVVRYEDMHREPEATLTKIVRFSGLEVKPNKIKEAVQFSSFALLKKQEKQEGFLMKQPTSPSFFRQGKVGEWKNELVESQIDKIFNQHTKIMSRLGYD